MTMCGKEHVLMLQQMLFTVATQWSLMPTVLAISDGSVTPAEIRRAFRWWPGSLETMDWRIFSEFHKERGRRELVQYAEKDPFGRKLSAILAMAEQRRVLWCDCDMLFFSDFSKLLPNQGLHGTLLETAEDSFYSYDARLTEEKLRHLYGFPAVNTGLVLCEGNFYEDCGLSEIVQQGMDACMYLTEQTILAEAVCKAGRVAWSLELIKMFNDDEATLTPTHFGQHWVARHYVGPIRHLFWRDALAVRLGSG